MDKVLESGGLREFVVNDGQQPDVKVRIRFEFGEWDAKVAIAHSSGNGEVVRLLDVNSFEDAVSKIRPILEKNGIK